MLFWILLTISQMKIYCILFLYLLILVLGKQGFSQYSGIYSSKYGEFVDFSLQGKFYALTEWGSKFSNTRMEFDCGIYEISNDTLYFLSDNHPNNKIVNIVTFVKNSAFEFVSFNFVCIDINKIPSSILKLEFYYEGSDSIETFCLKDEEKIKVHSSGINKVDCSYILDSRELIKFSLSGNDIFGNDIMIHSIHPTKTMQNKKFLIKDFSDISLTLIGPVIQDYKRKNRIKWFQSFRNWPWKWNFRKSHWYDPLEKKLILNQCKKMYFFSCNNEYP